MAWDVILEPEEPPFNLGGWKNNNEVMFEVDLPQDDTYTVTLEYSRPGQVGTAEGEIYLTQPGADISQIVEFPGTSEIALDWSVYKTVSCEVALSAGPSLLTISPVNIPPRSEHFINLRKVTFTGTKPATGIPETTAEPSTMPESVSIDNFTGWWVRSPECHESVLPEVRTFYVDAENGIWTSFSQLGTADQTLNCSFPEEQTIVMDLGDPGRQELFLDGGILYDPVTWNEAYVKTGDPDFLQVPSFAGTWVLADDDIGDGSYELTENTAVQTFDDVTGPIVSYEPCMQTVSIGSRVLDDQIFFLDLDWSGSDLYPNADGNVLIANGSVYHDVYIRMGDSVPRQYTQTLEMLVNYDFITCGDSDAERPRCLQLGADFTFAVCPGTWEEDGFSRDMEQVEAVGLWNLDENMQLHLKYSDGAEDVLDLQSWTERLDLEYVGLEFFAF